MHPPLSLRNKPYTNDAQLKSLFPLTNPLPHFLPEVITIPFGVPIPTYSLSFHWPCMNLYTVYTNTCMFLCFNLSIHIFLQLTTFNKINLKNLMAFKSNIYIPKERSCQGSVYLGEFAVETARLSFACMQIPLGWRGKCTRTSQGPVCAPFSLLCYCRCCELKSRFWEDRGKEFGLSWLSMMILPGWEDSFLFLVCCMFLSWQSVGFCKMFFLCPIRFCISYILLYNKQPKT